jgi:hypothetical protein
MITYIYQEYIFSKFLSAFLQRRYFFAWRLFNLICSRLRALRKHLKLLHKADNKKA